MDAHHSWPHGQGHLFILGDPWTSGPPQDDSYPRLRRAPGLCSTSPSPATILWLAEGQDTSVPENDVAVCDGDPGLFYRRHLEPKEF